MGSGGGGSFWRMKSIGSAIMRVRYNKLATLDFSFIEEEEWFFSTVGVRLITISSSLARAVSTGKRRIVE